MIKVVNLKTGEELFYDNRLTVKMAVVCAFESDRGNKNTWTYQEDKASLSKSGKTVFCGDFCALVDSNEILR